MELLYLSKFFGRRYSLFVLDVEDPSLFDVGDYISINGNDNLTVSRNSNPEAPACRACFASKQKEIDYSRCARSAIMRRFCRVVEKQGSNIRVEMLYDVPVQDDSLILGDVGESIAVTDGALDSCTAIEFERRFKQNYCREIDGKYYYLYGVNVHSDGSDGFILVDAEHNNYYSVLLKSIAELFPNDGDRNGDMWVIERGERTLTNCENYRFDLHHINIGIVDRTMRARASELTKINIKNGGAKYIRLWKSYADRENELVDVRCAEAGELEIVDIRGEGDNVYSFGIKNSASIEKFVDVVDTYFDGDVIVRLTPDKRKPIWRNGKISAAGSWKISDDERSRIFIKTDTELIIPKHFFGSIAPSVAGNKKQYERRKEALDAILSGTTVNLCLSHIIDGKVSRLKNRNARIQPNEQILREVFAPKAPNKSQRAAIETALNTPDFAIIQGPPGTGKTRVIRAILEHFQAESKNEIGDRHYLVTAFQNDATVNAVDGARDYLLGLPIFCFTRNDAESRKMQTMTDWCDERCAAVLKNNPQIERIASKRKVYLRLIAAYERIAEKSCSTQTACDILRAVRDILMQEIDGNNGREKDLYNMDLSSQINGVCKGINDVTARLQRRNGNKLLLSRYYISIIPTSTKSFEDGGAQRLKDIADYFEFSDDGVGQSVFSEQIATLKQLSRNETLSKPDVKTLSDVKVDMALALDKMSLLDEKSRQAALDIVKCGADLFECARVSEKDEILYDYYMGIQPTEELCDVVKKYGVSYAATHQKSADIDAYDLLDPDDKPDTASGLPEFDDILVDEAARSCPPDLMIPMACTRGRIILVGDDKQLPQYLNSDTVRELEIDDDEIRAVLSVLDRNSTLHDDDKDAVLRVSMFAYLTNTAEELRNQDRLNRVVMLDEQYRMPPTLGKLISEFFYDGKLKNGNDNVEDYRLDYPFIEKRNMLWLQVDSVGSGQRKENGSSYYREEEIGAILAALRKMKSKIFASEDKRGQKKTTIGIIAAYKAQKERIKRAIFEDSNNEFGERGEYIEVGTVDSFQGKEYDIVFFSLVRTDGRFGFLSSDGGKGGSNHAGAARTCVALSRAKKCMIIVGDSAMLCGKNEANARTSVPAIVDFYAACRDNRDNVCGIVKGEK